MYPYIIFIPIIYYIWSVDNHDNLKTLMYLSFHTIYLSQSIAYILLYFCCLHTYSFSIFLYINIFTIGISIDPWSNYYRPIFLSIHSRERGSHGTYTKIIQLNKTFWFFVKKKSVYFNFRAHSYTVTWIVFIGIWILR